MNLRTAATATLNTVDDFAVADAVELIHDSSVVVVTGVGKSSDMAHVGASLLQSVGVNAVHVSATDLLHGSLTLVRQAPRPLIIALTHSAQTHEVQDVLDEVRRFVVITGGSYHPPTEVEAVLCRYVIPAEGGKHGTVPSASLHGQLAYLAAMACLIADELTPGELGAGHPHGALGHRYRSLTSG